MTPKEKAQELYSEYYDRIEHTLSEEYSPHEKSIVIECVLIAVKELRNAFSAIYDDCISGDGWEGAKYGMKDYWEKVEQELINLKNE